MHETVGDRYELLERVGSGGTAEVWRATDRRTGADVALKRLHPEVAADPAARARFRGEMAAAAAVSHPNAVGVVDARDDERDGGPWLVMEHVPGGSLAARLGTRDLAPAAAMHVVADVAAALAALHGAGFVHRDVTPGNILLGVDGNARLADFGLARPAGQDSIEDSRLDLTAPGDVVGTLRFIAPEVLAGAVASPASDVWALGAVLYEALAGVPPFDASSPAALLASQRASPAPVPGAGGGVDTMVGAMLAVDPGSRPSAAEVAGGLRREAVSYVGNIAPDDLTAVRPLPGVAAIVAARPVDDRAAARVQASPRHRESRWAPAVVAAGLATLFVIALATGWPGRGTGAADDASGRQTPLVQRSPTPAATAAPVAPVAPRVVAPAGDGDDDGAGPGGQGGGNKGENPGKGKGRDKDD